MHLGSEYQVRVAAWLAVEMLAGRHGEPLGPGGTIEFLRGETQESVDDLLVGTGEAKYGFIQAKRALDFSGRLNSDFASVIDQMVRQVVVTPEQGSLRPWSRNLSPAHDRLLIATGPRSGERVRVVLRNVLRRARSLAPGQPLSDGALTEAERKVLQTTITLVRHSWKSTTGEEAMETQVRSLLVLISIEVLDVEEGQLAEREAKRTLGSMIIADAEQEGAAWSSVLKACRRMVAERSGLNLDSVTEQLRDDGIALKTAGLSSREAERARAQSNQIDKLIDEARDAIRQFDHPRARLLLERIERDHSSQLNNEQRFRIISNHGFAALGLGKPGEAAKRFLEAYAMQPQDEKARINEVLAYYVVGDAPTAFAKAEAIRPLYPASTELACYWVLASPAEKTAKDLESELSSIFLEDHKVRLALAQKARAQWDLDTAERHAEKAFSLDSTQGQPKLVSAQICMARIVELELGRGTQPRPRKLIFEQAERDAREAARLAEIQKDKQTQGEALALLVNILLSLGQKEVAGHEADHAFGVAPDDISVLLSRSQAQFANGFLSEGIASLRRAFATEPRADIAFHYGKALFERSKDNDLQTSVEVLAAINLNSIMPHARHSFALQTLQIMGKSQQWDEAKQYLEKNAALLEPPSLSVLHGLLAHYQKFPQEAEKHALAARTALLSSTQFDVRIQLGRLFMLVNRPADALPLFQEAFEADIALFDAGMLLDCAARQHRDDVVIETFRTLRKRGVKDWDTVCFGVQYLQKWVPSEAVDVLNQFIQQNPSHKLAKLYRSVLGILRNVPELVAGARDDLPTIHELPVDHVMQVIHVLRFVGDPDGAVDYAYRYLRLHFKEPMAHRAFLVSMSPFEPMPSIQGTLERVEIGAAVRYEEQPSGDSDWLVIEDTTDPSLEMKETNASSRIAIELIGKKVGDTFVLAPGMIDRRGVIRQIVPKYVRAYYDCGDRWQIRFPEEPMVQSMHLGKTEEEVRESIEKILQALQKQAKNDVEMREMYNAHSTSLHIFGKWHGRNAFHALIALASEDDQPVRTAFGIDSERKTALEGLRTSKTLVLDLSALATIRILDLDSILKTTRFGFQITANSWQELRETLREDMTDSPSIGVAFKDGQHVMLEETVAFKRKRTEANRAFLELVEERCEIISVEEVASLPPEKRDQFEQIFGQYGVETMLAAARQDAMLWSDDLVQSHIASIEFSTRRVWTQMLLAFLAEQNVISAKERDMATAKLIGLQYRVTFFDAPSFIEAVHLTGAKPWEQPLKTFIRELSVPEADLRILFAILEECIVRLYRESFLPENRCRVTTALLDAMWKNSASRRSIVNLRARSARMFLLNPVGEAQFNACFDRWIRQIENPIIPG